MSYDKYGIPFAPPRTSFPHKLRTSEVEALEKRVDVLTNRVCELGQYVSSQQMRLGDLDTLEEGAARLSRDLHDRVDTATAEWEGRLDRVVVGTVENIQLVQKRVESLEKVLSGQLQHLYPWITSIEKRLAALEEDGISAEVRRELRALYETPTWTMHPPADRELRGALEALASHEDNRLPNFDNTCHTCSFCNAISVIDEEPEHKADCPLGRAVRVLAEASNV